MGNESGKYLLAAKIYRMKKILCVISVILLAAAIFPFFGCSNSEDPIRIHIRANSDGDYDQAVKYVVRDAVVDFLSSELSSVSGRRDAYKRISALTKQIENTAMGVLSKCGFSYGANAYMSYEMFPDRTYGDIFYPEGYYDALIVELGTGNGGNWWCVAYPPLCFYGSDEEFRYSSIIEELLK